MNDKDLTLQRDKLILLSKAKFIYAFTGTLSKIEEECIKTVFKADII
jgi:hypothetical protein